MAGIFDTLPGLLTPDQQSSVKSQALMSAAVGLLNASGPSPYKHTLGPTLGAGLQGLLGGIQNGTNEALKQQLLRGQIGAQQLNILHAAAQYQGAGLPVPPQIEQMLKSYGLASGTPSAPAPAAAVPPQNGAAPAAPPNVTPAAGAAGVTGVPYTGAGAAPQLTNGTVGGPAAAPAAPPAALPANAPQSMAAMIQHLPVQDRYALVGGGPAADIIKQTLAKNAEITPEQKNATASGLPNPRALKANEALDTQDIGQEAKLYGGLQAQGNTSATMLDQINQARSIVNDPKFYSGPLEGANLAYKKILGVLSPEHANDALPQDAFRKVMAATILHQVDDMKASAAEMGSSSSRIFASQIEMMEKAAQNPDNSIAANRYLTEVSARAANRNIAIANMASDWKQAHNGRLGPDFEKHLRTYVQNNPMFTREELADIRKVAPAPNAAPAAAPAAQASAAPFAGRTATNPKTGARMREVAPGQWVQM